MSLSNEQREMFLRQRREASRAYFEPDVLVGGEGTVFPLPGVQRFRFPDRLRTGIVRIGQDSWLDMHPTTRLLILENASARASLLLLFEDASESEDDVRGQIGPGEGAYVLPNQNWLPEIVERYRVEDERRPRRSRRARKPVPIPIPGPSGSKYAVVTLGEPIELRPNAPGVVVDLVGLEPGTQQVVACASETKFFVLLTWGPRGGEQLPLAPGATALVEPRPGGGLDVVRF